jgi:mRNA interferase RelE/StbE
MAYNLVYHADVKRIDLGKIDNKNKKMIKRAIEERLATQPEIYGKPLQRSLKGYWKLRVGEYRIVFKMSKNDIFVLGIMDRKNIYSQIKKRKDHG